MEMFALVRKHLAMSGISRENPSQMYPFNRINSIVLIIISLDVMFLVNFLNEAKTFQEYTNILYEIIVMCNFMIIFLKIVWKSSELLKFIDDLENTIEESE